MSLQPDHTINTKQHLHQLLDTLPEAEMELLTRFLEMHPVDRAILLAPLDDEPLTPEEAEDIRQNREDPRPSIPFDDVKEELGLL